MTTEEKAKAYDEALERAKSMISDLRKGEDILAVSDLESMFPELKESEDEKIRKEIISHLQHEYVVKRYVSDVEYDKWIAWLEKLGESVSVDKIKSKFHEGDWVIRSAEGFKHNTYLVTEVKDYYVCEDLKGRRVTFTFNDVHKNFKLWDISDAKDGDVLAAYECIVLFKEIDGLNIKCYCTYHYMGFNPSFHVDTLQNKDAFYPATKEQRELLFAKMEEAGYVWNAEKKELSKIGQKSNNNIEPKFKVGDWIVQENEGIYQVVEISKSWYEVIDIEGFHYSISFVKEYMCHLWTIKDAKEGDILMANAPFIFNGNLEGGIGCPGAHCAINTLGEFQIPTSPKHWTGHTTTPATKEQRDLLFKKMRESGYEWNESKKELEKIEQKPTWSEEDEKMLKKSINLLDEFGGDRKAIAYTLQEMACRNCADWLQSLKQRLGGEK